MEVEVHSATKCVQNLERSKTLRLCLIFKLYWSKKEVSHVFTPPIRLTKKPLRSQHINAFSIQNTTYQRWTLHGRWHSATQQPGLKKGHRNNWLADEVSTACLFFESGCSPKVNSFVLVLCTRSPNGPDYVQHCNLSTFVNKVKKLSFWSAK